MDRTTYAVDLAKSVMQLHWVDAESGEISRRRLSRAKFLPYFAALQPVRIVMEACGSAHHWARELRALGHSVELLPPHHTRSFVRGNKDDAADARGIWLAGQHSDIRRVPIKTVDQQAMLALHSARKHWIDVRTATVNALRGLLYEFGIVLPKGRRAGIKRLQDDRARIDEVLPAPMRLLVNEQLSALGEIEAHVEQLEREIAACSGCAAQRLRDVPGLGLLCSTALAAKLGDGSAWRSGREFAASLGVVPAHTGTGGKNHVGHISKRGDAYLRTLLIHGARSVLRHGKHKSKWLEELLRRRPFNVVATALANKLARVAWTLVAHSRKYDAAWKGSPAQHASSAAAPA